MQAGLKQFLLTLLVHEKKPVANAFRLMVEFQITSRWRARLPRLFDV